MRLQRILARAGVGSRRQCERFIAEGRIKVNGNTVTELGSKADPQEDAIEFDGERVCLPKDHITIMLNKPCGYLTTKRDDRGRRTVMDLVCADEHPSIFPIGRLDRDTSGMLLMTTDGNLGQRLAHPSSHVSKTYLVEAKGNLSQEDVHRLVNGISLDGKMTLPAKFEMIEAKPDSTICKLTISEGRNRQVRRMFKAIGHDVASLKRVAIGKLELKDLPEGSYRELDDQDIALLGN